MLAVTFSAGSGGVLSTLLMFLLILVGAAAIWAVGRWIGKAFGAPETALKVWDVIFVIVGLIFFINLVAGWTGHAFLVY